MSGRPKRSQYTAAQKGKGIAGSSHPDQEEHRVRRSEPARRTRNRRTEPQAPPQAPPQEESQDDTTEAGTEREDVPARRKHHTAKKRPRYSVFKHLIRSYAFVPTRFPDPTLLQHLGIYDDVQILLSYMGLGRMLHMSYPGYQNFTAGFLASLDVVHHWSSPTAEDGHGYITFRANKTGYKVPFKALSEIYGFPDRPLPKLQGDKNSATQFWLTLGSGPHKPGTNKNSDIRHPALRYVHKILTHSFYARRETGGVNEIEMRFLDRAIAPLIGYYVNGVSPSLLTTHIGICGVFADCLMKMQHWCYTTTDTTPQISVGGWITPILEYVGCLEGAIPTVEPLFIDEAYLTDAAYLDGRLARDRSITAYKFHKIHDRAKVRMLLPHPARTNVMVRENLIFDLEPHEFYNPAIHGLLEKVDERGASPQAAHDPAPEPEPVYGPSRYYFEPYGEPLPAGPLREAHEHIHRLNRWNRYQDRAIRNLTKSVATLKKCVRKLNKKVFAGSSGSCRHRTDATMRDEFDAPIPEHRHSYQGDLSLALVPADAPRASYYETRRPRHHFPSPPPNLSANELEPLDTPTSSDHSGAPTP